MEANKMVEIRDIPEGLPRLRERTARINNPEGLRDPECGLEIVAREGFYPGPSGQPPVWGRVLTEDAAQAIARLTYTTPSGVVRMWGYRWAEQSGPAQYPEDAPTTVGA